MFYAGDEAKVAWAESGPVSSKYVESHLGNNIYINNHVEAKALETKNKKARISIFIPSDHINSAALSRICNTSYGLDHYDGDVGVSFKNKDTKKVTEFLIDENSVTLEKSYNYKGLTHLILGVITNNLETGTYEYQTYIVTDAVKLYSDNVYEYTKDICPDANHPHWIDLGFPSGTQWRCCNEGASTPEAYGGYYTFGQVSSAPTRDQVFEFLNNTTQVWTTQNGVNGCKFTSKINGGTVFLPAAGDRLYGEFVNVGARGNYWSSTPYDKDLAYAVGFSPSSTWYLDRRHGYEHSVRPVR